MTVINTIENVRATFAMENMVMSKEDEQRGRDILEGKKTIEQIISEIKEKYVSLRN